MKQNLTLNLRQKITFALLIVILLLCCNAFIGIYINRKCNGLDFQLNTIYNPLIETIEAIDKNQSVIIDYSKKWLVSQLPEEKHELKTNITINYNELRLSLGNLSGLTNNKVLQKKLNTIILNYDELKTGIDEIVEMLTTQADFENVERFSYCKNNLHQIIIPGMASKRLLLAEAKKDVSVIIDDLFSKSKRLISVQLYITNIVTVIIILILIYLLYWLPGLFINRLKSLKVTLEIMLNGNIPERIESNKEDEIGQIEKSIDLLGQDMENIKNFIGNIGSGNYEIKVNVFNGEGMIGAAFDEMKKSLIDIARKQEEIRKEEEKQNWVNTGIAHFNEILRIKNDDIDELSYEIVKELVKYTNSIIGGVYILKDVENANKLVMSGLFAYERKRYIETAILPGEGLIGTVFIEKHKVHIKEIPTDYIKISSGLGEAPPRELLIIPVIQNDRIFGVIEIATLQSYNDHIIAFIERIAEGLASSISSVMTNTQTNKLLEESKEKAERLHAQEEELRQNMEEMHATQEESERLTKQLEEENKKLLGIINKIPNPVYLKDEKRRYIMINDEVVKFFGLSTEEIIGKTDEQIIMNEVEVEISKKSDLDILLNKKKIVLPDQNITLPNGDQQNRRTIKLPLMNNLTNQVNILGITYIF